MFRGISRTVERDKKGIERRIDLQVDRPAIPIVVGAFQPAEDLVQIVDTSVTLGIGICSHSCRALQSPRTPERLMALLTVATNSTGADCCNVSMAL